MRRVDLRIFVIADSTPYFAPKQPTSTRLCEAFPVVMR